MFLGIIQNQKIRRVCLISMICGVLKEFVGVLKRRKRPLFKV